MLDTAIEVKARLKSGDSSFKPFAGGLAGAVPCCWGEAAVRAAKQRAALVRCLVRCCR